MPDNPTDNGTANPGPPQTPAERLKALQQELQGDDDQLSNLTKARDALKADVASLTKTVDEINKAEAGYTKALDGLNEEKTKLKDYHAKLGPMLDGVLGAKKGDVDTKINEVEKKITDQAAAVETARTNSDKAANDAQDAQTNLDAKQLAYDGYKNLQKDLGDKIQKMQSFRTIIDKFDDAKPASMYVFLRELKTTLDKTDIPTQAAFEAELNKRWKELDDAKETAREKKLAAEAAKDKLTGEQTNLDALSKSRVDDLVKATDGFN